jgi:hypothetical protein
MGLLHADCATKLIETSIHGTGNTRLLASQGKGLSADFGVTTSLRPSAHQVPFSTSGVASSSKGQLFFPGGGQNSKRKNMVFEKSPLPDSNFLTIASTMGISPEISSATDPLMRQHHEGSKTCPMNPKELWQVLYESCFAVSNSSTEHSAVSLSSTSASSDGATIHTSHNSEDACKCTPTGQETSAVSPPRDSPFNDANNSRSCITPAQCVEKHDITSSNTIDDTGDDDFLAASSNFFGDSLCDSCVSARQAARLPASVRTYPRQHVDISSRPIDKHSQITFQKYGAQK